MKDFAVVGSGVGGSSIAAYLSHKGYEVALFEKEPYLGGCSSTFSKKGYHYNTGATTLAGYQEGHLVKEFLDELGIKPSLGSQDGKPRTPSQPLFCDIRIGTIAGTNGANYRVTRPQHPLCPAWSVLCCMLGHGFYAAPLRI